MKHFIYRMYVMNYGKVVKTFLGNDENELYERFEMWFIKTGYDRENIEVSINYVQHANN